MALFRIYKGPANKLENQPLVNGYAYFTPDDGKFYIDTDTERVPLNAYSADVLTSKPTIKFETADQDTDKAACIKITVGGKESDRYELPYANASHSGVLSLLAQEIYGVKTFKSSPVFSSGATLGSGQAIKDSSGKTIIGLAESTNPQAGGLYLYTSGDSNLYHNGKSILTTQNFNTLLQTTLDNRYVNVTGDTMSGSLNIVTTSGDAQVRVNNTTHGVALKATSNARGLYDEKTGSFLLYSNSSNNNLYIAPNNANSVIFGNGTASATKYYEFPTYTTVELKGAVGFTGEAVLLGSGTLFYIGKTNNYGITTDEDDRAIMSVGDFLAENIEVSNSAQIDTLSVVKNLGVGGTIGAVGNISTNASIEAVANITAGATISAPTIHGTTTVKGGTLQATNTHTTQALTVAGGGTFGETIAAKTATIGAGGATIGGNVSITGTTSAQHINPSTSGTYSLGTSSLKWNKVYATTFEGNATSATKFNSTRTISLSGDVSGSVSSTGESGWSITNTAIGAGKVTNAMLAGSIANAKLVNSSMTIAGTSVSLGGSISADTLRANLGLTNAMHYIGIATVAITNQSNTDPKISGYTWPDKRQAGDVIIYSGKEYVWNGTSSHWELLGDEGSYKVLQTAVTSPAVNGNASAFIDTISQDANGKITATKKNVQITVSASGSGDGVVNITPTSGTNGVTYNVTHTKKGPSSGTATYTSGNSVMSITGAATSFSIPQISVDTYGHTTAAADETITITLPKSGSWFNNGFATVDTSGISKLGRYLYFHGSSASTNTYDVRIDATTDAKQNTLYLPAETGQFVIHTNNTAIGSGTNPVYIAASGVATASTSTEGSASLPVYLNAGTITACSGASIFSDFSSTAGENGETLSLTIAGQKRTVTLDNLAKGTAQTASSTKSHGATFTAITDFSVSGHTITPTVTTYTLPSETTLSKGTNATASASKSHGSTFTAITGISVSDHTITPTVTTYTLPSETTLSKGTNATASSSVSHGGTFTAITGLAVSGHTITPTVTTYTLPSESQTLSGLGGIGSITFSGKALTKSGTSASISQADARSALGLGSAAYVATSTFAPASHTHTWSQISDRKTLSIDTSGTIKGSKVYNAVWNDYAEFRKAETIEPGRVVIEDISGEMKVSTERLQPGASIVSDTFGSAMGETDDCKTPLAVAGRALAYTYEDRDSYSLGAAVCTGPNGTVSLMTREEIMMYPERIVGTVSEIPNYETWGTGNVKVNGRIWIKVH